MTVVSQLELNRWRLALGNFKGSVSRDFLNIPVVSRSGQQIGTVHEFFDHMLSSLSVTIDPPQEADSNIDTDTAKIQTSKLAIHCDQAATPNICILAGITPFDASRARGESQADSREVLRLLFPVGVIAGKGIWLQASLAMTEPSSDRMVHGVAGSEISILPPQDELSLPDFQLCESMALGTEFDHLLANRKFISLEPLKYANAMCTLRGYVSTRLNPAILSAKLDVIELLQGLNLTGKLLKTRVAATNGFLEPFIYQTEVIEKVPAPILPLVFGRSEVDFIVTLVKAFDPSLALSVTTLLETPHTVSEEGKNDLLVKVYTLFLTQFLYVYCQLKTATPDLHGLKFEQNALELMIQTRRHQVAPLKLLPVVLSGVKQSFYRANRRQIVLCLVALFEQIWRVLSKTQRLANLQTAAQLAALVEACMVKELTVCFFKQPKYFPSFEAMASRSLVGVNFEGESAHTQVLEAYHAHVAKLHQCLLPSSATVSKTELLQELQESWLKGWCHLAQSLFETNNEVTFPANDYFCMPSRAWTPPYVEKTYSNLKELGLQCLSKKNPKAAFRFWSLRVEDANSAAHAFTGFRVNTLKALIKYFGKQDSFSKDKLLALVTHVKIELLPKSLWEQVIRNVVSKKEYRLLAAILRPLFEAQTQFSKEFMRDIHLILKGLLVDRALRATQLGVPTREALERSLVAGCSLSRPTERQPLKPDSLSMVNHMWQQLLRVQQQVTAEPSASADVFLVPRRPRGRSVTFR